MKQCLARDVHMHVHYLRAQCGVLFRGVYNPFPLFSSFQSFRCPRLLTPSLVSARTTRCHTTTMSTSQARVLPWIETPLLENPKLSKLAKWSVTDSSRLSGRINTYW